MLLDRPSRTLSLSNANPQLLATLQALLQAAPGLIASQSAPPAEQTPPAAPVSTYTNSRPQAIPSASRGHPNASTAAPGSQPFLGPSSLGVGMSSNTNRPRHSNSALTSQQISQANSARTLAAQAHSSAIPQLATRGRRRPRGAARPPPSLPSAPTSPDSTIEVDPFTGQKNIAVEVHVLLSTSEPVSQYHVVQLLQDTLLAWLDSKNLRYFYTVAENSTLLSLIETVVRDMRDSESQWIFGSTSSPIARFLRPHERLELYLLSLVNRGVARSSNGAIMLRKQLFDCGITISDLLGNENLYAKPFLCIRDSRLIIRLAVAQQGISCLTDRDGEGPVSRHSCLSEFMHSLFSIENDIARDTSRWTPPPCTCTEAGRDIDGESEMDAQELEDLFRLCAEPPGATRWLSRHALWSGYALWWLIRWLEEQLEIHFLRHFFIPLDDLEVLGSQTPGKHTKVLRQPSVLQEPA
ncbi:hypothetical protein R3P38DRAFT_3180030 [Favolaschia claudopus]|uniref:Uncharacterized protein n=1 Tax=Favolaschia claudopus TaxID=2862362 RepID=A0AAW0CRU4_9AGAR